MAETDRVKAIAGEISHLVPKLLRGMRAGFITSPHITAAQMVTLMRIYEKGKMRLGDLSKEMHVSAPTMTGLVDRLMRSGYVLRTHDKKDRRVINVELTRAGKKQAESIISEINKRWHGILVHLTKEERENYLRILKRIVNVLSIKND